MVRGPALMGDSNKDGFKDFFVAGWNGNGSFAIYKNDGTNKVFTDVPDVNKVILGYPSGSLLVKDFNGDGFDEIFTCGWAVTGLYKNSLATKLDENFVSSISIHAFESSIQVQNANASIAQSSKIDIFNTFGKSVARVISDESTITIPNIKAGIYLVRVVSGTESKTTKLIIQ